MSDWKNKYLPKPIDRKNRNQFHFFRSFKSNLIVVWHSLFPHQWPDIKEMLPDLPYHNDVIAETAFRIYEESRDRINKIEEKSFKLLSYITALLTLSTYLLSIYDDIISVVVLALGIILLLLSLFFSFRGLNIKTIKSVNFNSLYDFENEGKSEEDIQKELSKEYLNASVFNNNIADNQADILKATRFVLIASFTLIFLSSITFLKKDHTSMEDFNNDVNLEIPFEEETTGKDSLNTIESPAIKPDSLLNN
jgi:hypothetical protein